MPGDRTSGSRPGLTSPIGSIVRPGDPRSYGAPRWAQPAAGRPERADPMDAEHPTLPPPPSWERHSGRGPMEGPGSRPEKRFGRPPIFTPAIREGVLNELRNKMKEEAAAAGSRTPPTDQFNQLLQKTIEDALPLNFNREHWAPLFGLREQDATESTSPDSSKRWSNLYRWPTEVIAAEAERKLQKWYSDEGRADFRKWRPEGGGGTGAIPWAAYEKAYREAAAPYQKLWTQSADPFEGKHPFSMFLQDAMARQFHQDQEGSTRFENHDKGTNKDYWQHKTSEAARPTRKGTFADDLADHQRELDERDARERQQRDYDRLPGVARRQVDYLEGRGPLPFEWGGEKQRLKGGVADPLTRPLVDEDDGTIRPPRRAPSEARKPRFTGVERVAIAAEAQLVENTFDALPEHVEPMGMVESMGGVDSIQRVPSHAWEAKAASAWRSTHPERIEPRVGGERPEPMDSRRYDHPMRALDFGGRKFWLSRTFQAMAGELAKRLAARRKRVAAGDPSLAALWRESVNAVDPSYWSSIGPGAAGYYKPGGPMSRMAIEAAADTVFQNIDWSKDRNQVRADVVAETLETAPELDSDEQQMIRDAVFDRAAGRSGDVPPLDDAHATAEKGVERAEPRLPVHSPALAKEIMAAIRDELASELELRKVKDKRRMRYPDEPGPNYKAIEEDPEAPIPDVPGRPSRPSSQRDLPQIFDAGIDRVVSPRVKRQLGLDDPDMQRRLGINAIAEEAEASIPARQARIEASRAKRKTAPPNLAPIDKAAQLGAYFDVVKKYLPLVRPGWTGPWPGYTEDEEHDPTAPYGVQINKAIWDIGDRNLQERRGVPLAPNLLDDSERDRGEGASLAAGDGTYFTGKDGDGPSPQVPYSSADEVAWGVSRYFRRLKDLEAQLKQAKTPLAAANIQKEIDRMRLPNMKNEEESEGDQAAKPLRKGHPTFEKELSTLRDAWNQGNESGIERGPLHRGWDDFDLSGYIADRAKLYEKFDRPPWRGEQGKRIPLLELFPPDERVVKKGLRGE